MFKDGEVLQRRYRIQRRLGKGGMGYVYLATDMEMAAEVVVKQSIVGNVESLRRDKEYGKLTEEELQDVVESSRRAFEREAKLLYGLRHHGLPRVMAYHEAEQFLVMKYVPGKDLSELLADRLRQGKGPFPPDKVLGRADQILDALHYLHTKFDEPIIHRDIKPANLKLTPDGQIFLLDFGLAKGARPGMTAAQSILAGTKEYAPIEQLDVDENARQKTDPRSDLYSLAMTLHHLLSGRFPAKTISRVSAKAQGESDPLRPVHELVPAVPAAVSEVLQSAGAVFAKDRLKTAVEMRTLLRQPLVSPPPVIVTTAEPPPDTIVRPRRNITISLNSEEPNPAPPAKIENPEPPTRQPSGWLTNLSGKVASWINAEDYQPPPPPTPPPLRQLKPPESKPAANFSDNLNGVKLEIIYVPGGKFTMGSEKNDREKPPHEVTVPAFYIGKFQVTQAQWKAVMGDKLKPCFTGDNLPMESVSWNDAKDFCKKLTQMTNKAYRLPSEAEWEYACRAGTTTEFAFGDSLSSDQANFDGDYPYGEAPKSVYRQKTTPVGSFDPNAFGLYDMHGNVWEWCEDVRHDNYQKAPNEGSAWLSEGDSSFRVVRGGSWGNYGVNCRSAVRLWVAPGYRNDYFGFRVVVSCADFEHLTLEPLNP